MVSIDLKCPQSITNFRAFLKAKITQFSSKQGVFLPNDQGFVTISLFDVTICDQTSHYHFDYYQFS